MKRLESQSLPSPSELSRIYVRRIMNATVYEDYSTELCSMQRHDLGACYVFVGGLS